MANKPSSSLLDSVQISSQGMNVAKERARLASQNLANAQTTDDGTGKPYQREMGTFKAHLDKATGSKMVSLRKIVKDPTPFEMRYEPHHPQANADGYVAYPNVNSIFEVADHTDANHAYQANIQLLRASKEMFIDTLDILK